MNTRGCILGALACVALFWGCDTTDPPDNSGPYPVYGNCDTVTVYDSTWIGDSLVVESRDVPLWVFDTMVVRSILDDINLPYVSIFSVTDIHLPTDSCGRIIELDLSALGMTRLPAQVGLLEELRVLKVYNNVIDSLPSSITGLHYLNRLEAQRCGLQSLPEGFCGLDSLQTLYLHGNELERLPDSIGSMWGLTRLELTDNLLDSLPESIMALPNLAPRYLTVSDNYLCAVSAEMDDWLVAMSYEGQGWRASQYAVCDATPGDTMLVRTVLDSLGLPDVAVGEVSDMDLGRVVSVDLSGRGLTDVPPELLELSGLQRLTLAGNSIPAFPAEVDSLVRLTSLDLSGNPLQSGLEIPSFPSLQRLVLAAAGLTGLPAGISDHDSTLTLLDLTGNALDSQSLVSLPELLVIDTLLLSHCGASALPPWLAQSGSLRLLDISGNGIDTLTDLSGLVSLQVLHADSNVLSTLPPLDGLAALDVLTVEGNVLASVPVSIGQLSELDTLDLRNNQLTSLPSQVYNLDGIDTVLVDGNSICSPGAAVEVWLDQHAGDGWASAQLCP